MVMLRAKWLVTMEISGRRDRARWGSYFGTIVMGWSRPFFLLLHVFFSEQEWHNPYSFATPQPPCFPSPVEVGFFDNWISIYFWRGVHEKSKLYFRIQSMPISLMSLFSRVKVLCVWFEIELGRLWGLNKHGFVAIVGFTQKKTGIPSDDVRCVSSSDFPCPSDSRQR